MSPQIWRKLGGAKFNRNENLAEEMVKENPSPMSIELLWIEIQS